MADASVRSSLQITKDEMVYRSQPTQFNATMTGSKGPTPGAVAVSTAVLAMVGALLAGAGTSGTSGTSGVATGSDTSKQPDSVNDKMPPSKNVLIKRLVL